MSASDADLVTPEAVVLDLGVAGIATRILAKLLDLVCLALTSLLLLTLIGLVAGLSGSEVITRILLALTAFLLIVFIPALCETLWSGRTPGKAAFGLRVVTDEGGPISFRHAIVRGLLGVIEVFTGMGLVVALANPLNKRLGDMATGTQVIVDRPWEEPLVPTVFFPPPGCEQYVSALDVGRLTSEHFLLIRTFLLRVSQLSPAARAHLALRIAGPLRSITQPDPPPGMHPEVFLICLASAFQMRHGGLPERYSPAVYPPGPGFAAPAPPYASRW